MGTALKFSILAGLMLWGLLLFDKMQPIDGLHTATQQLTDKSRCEKYTRTVEGEVANSYGDRLRQFTHGCW